MTEMLTAIGENDHKLPRGIEYWPVEKNPTSRLKGVNFDDLPFGKIFSDHMLVADYEDGAWREVTIRPFENLSISPANLGLHYGQSIFEGIKAYKDTDGRVYIFRPDQNFDRFIRSAERMAMPAVPSEIFMDGMLQLVDLDKDWIPTKEGSSLYIRPLMFATDEAIGVRPGRKYTFLIMTSPTGPYYNKPLKLYVEDYFVRAAKGGVGAAKTAGNYAASLYPTELALQKGYDQILWTDAEKHKYLQECGTMNLFVVIDGKVITPDLDGDTILSGVTRDSVLQILSEMSIPVEERAISIDEVLTAQKKGTLQEIFGSGTAANIIYIEELVYHNHSIKLKPISEWTLAPSILKELNDIHYGRSEDTREWMRIV